MTKYCASCGEELNPDIKFCENCGALVKEKTKTVVVTEQVNNTNTPIKSSNTYSIVGFVMSIINIPVTLITCCGAPLLGIPAIIVSIIGLVKAKDYDGDGKGLAIAAISISAVLILLFIALFAFIEAIRPAFG